MKEHIHGNDYIRVTYDAQNILQLASVLSSKLKKDVEIGGSHGKCKNFYLYIFIYTDGKLVQFNVLDASENFCVSLTQKDRLEYNANIM